MAVLTTLITAERLSLKPRRVALLLAAAALLAAFSAATASAASPEGGTIVRVKFEPRASDGFEALVENTDAGGVVLLLERAPSRVAYEVEGKITETGLKAQFGRLGRIDVAFTPTRTLSSTEPAGDCTGAPRTVREGVFSGTLEFTGERGYVQLEGPQAEGTMRVISEWQCPGEMSLPYARTSLLAALSAPDGGRERETASLLTFNRGCGCQFAAGVHHRHSGGRSIFYGVKEELRERMGILRVTSVPGPASAFDYDHEAGTATLRPPLPLTGRATFKRRRGGRALWRSTITVPLLGTDRLRTRAPGTGAWLYREYHFD